jgi:hypothetical protein
MTRNETVVEKWLYSPLNHLTRLLDREYSMVSKDPLKLLHSASDFHVFRGNFCAMQGTQT